MPVFRPAGEKPASKRTENTLLPQAMHNLEVATA
jgi:hypothetical protein